MDQGNEVDDGICLLSLDGGGPGSVSQLQIIGEYMARLAHDRGVEVDSLFLADLFDIIGGVGFAAYIAILVGPLRMSISAAAEELVMLVTALFPTEQKVSLPEVNTNKLKYAIEDMLRRRQLPIDIKLKDDRLPGPQCKAVVFVTPYVDATACVPLRTYSSPDHSLDCTLVEAICAALAIPSLFSPIYIGSSHQQQSFSSACFGFINPTRQLLQEAAKQFGPDRRVSTILSVGTGRTAAPSVDSLSTSSSKVGHDLLLQRMITDSERIARELSSQLFDVDAYLRLNVDYGMENLSMSDWNDLGAIKSHTDIYLQATTVTHAIDSSLRKIRERVGLIALEQLNRSTGIKAPAKIAPAVSPYFVTRRKYWDEMERLLVIAPEAKRKILVLSGMGGCGKTQLVSYFVQQHHTRYRHIFFVDASSTSSIRSDLQAAIRGLGPGYEQKTSEGAIEFLAKGPHEGNWLFILDNADNPKLDPLHYLPKCFHGTIIITTRNLELGNLATTTHLKIGPMEEEECYEVLTRAAGRRLPLSEDENIAAKQLMSELGNLAVALVQAGRYCHHISPSLAGSDEGYYTFRQYLILFQKHRSELMKAKLISLDDYGRGAYTTFDLSYTLLPQIAQEFLHFCSFLHHTDISLAMLERAANAKFKNYSDDELRRLGPQIKANKQIQMLLCSDGKWNELHIHNIIHSSQSFSLISATSVSGTVFLRLHPLIHSWSRDILRTDDAVNYRQMAVQTVAICAIPSNNMQYRGLLSHVLALVREVPIAEIHLTDQTRFGHVLVELADYPKAELLFQNALKFVEEDPNTGKEHVNHINISSSLGKIYRRQGRWDEAEKLQTETLKRSRTLLGEDHTETLNAANNLALTYQEQGRWVEAEKIQLEVLAQHQRLNGKDHKLTILAANNLAGTYIGQERWREAEKIQLEVLEQRRRLLGKAHLDTIIAASNLSFTYHGQKRWNEAERILLEVLDQRQRLLGKGHPDTIMSIDRLAWTYFNQGRREEAEKLQSEVVEASKKSLRGTASSYHPLHQALIGHTE